MGHEFFSHGLPCTFLGLFIQANRGLIRLPPGIKQIVGFVVEMIFIEAFLKELAHGLAQLLVAGKVEDDFHAWSAAPEILITLLERRAGQS